MKLQSKRLILVLAITLLILLIPFIGMQFTSEINWSLGDFIVAAILLFVAGILIEFTLRKTAKTTLRMVLIATIILVLILLWAELAVGIFGSPFAGN